MTPTPHWHHHALVANGQVVCPVCGHKHNREFMYPSKGTFEDPKRNPKNFALYRQAGGQLVLVFDDRCNACGCEGRHATPVPNRPE